jgi:hypothetical protein
MALLTVSVVPLVSHPVRSGWSGLAADAHAETMPIAMIAIKVAIAFLVTMRSLLPK